MENEINYFNDETDQLQIKRTGIVDWIVDICTNQKLNQRTIHLAIMLMDKYMIISELDFDHLSGIAAVCLLIATKIEENYSITVDEIIDIVDYEYDRNFLLKIEEDILIKFNYQLHIQT